MSNNKITSKNFKSKIPDVKLCLRRKLNVDVEKK